MVRTRRADPPPVDHEGDSMADSRPYRRPDEALAGRRLRGRRGAGLAALACVAMVGVVSACGGGGGGDDGAGPTPAATGPAAVTRTTPRAARPAAELSPLTGGKGVFVGAAAPANVSAVGYVEQEFAAAGTATSYRADGALAQDGRWSFAPDASAPYRTRVLVRRPADPKKFSGTVVFEWMNVSGGVDADPEWTSL